jgi:hypothetical protein
MSIHLNSLRDAVVITKSIAQIEIELPASIAVKFRSIVLTDIAKITLLCGIADRDFGEEERSFFQVTVAGVMFGHAVIINGWEDMTENTRKQVVEVSNKLLNEIRANPNMPLQALALLRQLGSSSFTAQSNLKELYTRYGKYVVAADQVVTDDERRVLKRVIDWVNAS